MTIASTIASIVFLTGSLAAALAVSLGTVRAGGRQKTRVYDPERLRQDMIESAENDEERRYLEEMDALELHRRHLVC